MGQKEQIAMDFIWIVGATSTIVLDFDMEKTEYCDIIHIPCRLLFYNGYFSCEISVILQNIIFNSLFNVLFWTMTIKLIKMFDWK